MGIRVRVQDQASTGEIVGGVELEDIPAAITVRDLIRTRVRDEVARHNADAGARRVDWQAQADRTVEAFTGNGFFVLVDDRQATELDQELALTPDSDIRFVRLVQLAGG